MSCAKIEQEDLTAERIAEWQRTRIEKALGEGARYVFRWHGPINKWSCFNPVSGRTYLLTAEGRCDCADSLCRGRYLKCKHSLSLALYKLVAPINQEKLK